MSGSIPSYQFQVCAFLIHQYQLNTMAFHLCLQLWCTCGTKFLHKKMAEYKVFLILCNTILKSINFFRTLKLVVMCRTMFEVLCLINRSQKWVFEFNYQKMNTFEFIRCSKNDVRVRTMFDKMVFDPSL